MGLRKFDSKASKGPGLRVEYYNISDVKKDNSGQERKHSAGRPCGPSRLGFGNGSTWGGGGGVDPSAM